MSGKLIDIKRRVQSVRNTQKMTRAMKSVSAAKLRKSLTAFQHLKRYMTRMEDILRILLEKVDREDYPVLLPKKEGRPTLVVIASDKGLCGSFNSRIMEKYEELREEMEDAEVIAVGRKAVRYFQKRDVPLLEEYSGLAGYLTFESSRRLSRTLRERFKTKSCQKVTLIYSPYHPLAQQRVVTTDLFPLSLDSSEEPRERPVEPPEFIIEPPPPLIFQPVIEEYIPSRVYRILLESQAAEHRERMVAMDMATQNASDLLKQLTLTMNRIRQESITSELLEIISTTEAMR